MAESNKTVGPVFTTQDGQLSKPVLMCAWGAHRCRHLSIHDWHYPYCSAQPDTSPALRPGAGTHLHWAKPNNECPYVGSTKEGNTNG